MIIRINMDTLHPLHVYHDTAGCRNRTGKNRCPAADNVYREIILICDAHYILNIQGRARHHHQIRPAFRVYFQTVTEQVPGIRYTVNRFIRDPLFSQTIFQFLLYFERFA